MEFIYIDLIITIFVYLIFPIIYRLCYGKVPKSNGKIIALVNSIICSIIFIIFRAVLSGGEVTVVNFAPAVFYYFIAKAILIDKNLTEKEYEARLVSKEESGNIPGRCPECNNKISKDDEECYVCGYILKRNTEEDDKTEDEETKKD